jgi:F-type H+-transporting ATPase subunit b
MAAIGVLGAAGMAHAEDGEATGPKGHAEEECIHILEEGGEIDECQEAPNPILPEANELIWGGLSFAIVFILLAKFAFPALKQAIAGREEAIRGDLEAAERARTDAESVRSRYEQQLADARVEAGTIIEEARSAAEQVRRDIVARAEGEADEIRSRAQADIAIQRERALAELRNDVAAMSIDLAEKIVERNLDRDTQMALVESFINQVGRDN